MNSPVPTKPIDGDDPSHSTHEHHHATYAAEATGLLVMAVLLLILTVIRYWRDIPWSAR